MKRKIIKQGHNTLTVTLPSDWVKKLNVKAGDEVEIYEKETSLVINGHENPEHKKAIIDLKNVTIPLLWRFFQGAYRSGCDEIKVLFDPNKKEYEDAYHFYTSQFDYSKLGEKSMSKPAIAMIQSVVDRFIGMGIIETGKDYCIIKEMGESTVKEFENSLRRVFLVIQQMYDRIIEAIEKNEINDKNLCKEMHTIDLNIDRFVDYCCRLLNKLSANFPDSKKMLLFSTLYLLELLGDEAKYVGKHLALSKKPVKDLVPFAVRVKEHFDLYYHMFYKYDRATAIKFGELDYELYNVHFKVKEKLTGEVRSIARHLMTMSKFAWVLGELRIEMEY